MKRPENSETLLHSDEKDGDTFINTVKDSETDVSSTFTLLTSC